MVAAPPPIGLWVHDEPTLLEVTAGRFGLDG